MQPFLEDFPSHQASLSTTQSHQKKPMQGQIMEGQCSTNSVKIQRHEMVLSILGTLSGFIQNEGGNGYKEED